MIEAGVNYYWQSPKDGAFYRVKWVSSDKQLKLFKFRIVELMRVGDISKPLETINNVKKIYEKDFNSVDFNVDFDIMLVDYLVGSVNKNTESFETKLKMFAELIPLFDKHPDLHYKALEKLGKNPIFNKLINKEISLKKALEVIKG